MKKAQLARRFPRASQGFFALNETHGENLASGSAGPATELERDRGDALDEVGQDENSGSGKYLVRIGSIRRRLLDDDNLCEKWHVDSLRYAGILPSDAPDRCRIETSQRLCQAGEEEKTLIEVFRM